MISFIIPAHNEQAVLGRTLLAIHEAARPLNQPYEIIVANDASTDGTAEIAQQHQAKVVNVNNRQIAATRNSGARVAQGERFFFVDADTVINSGAVAEAMRYMDKGAVGGGATVRFDGDLPLSARFAAFVAIIIPKLVGFTGGVFMFCTREAFRATGGFNERLYFAEEGGFAMALKCEGRFVVLWRPVLTSGRRLRTMSVRQFLPMLSKFFYSPARAFTERSSVEKIWYDSNRESDDKLPNSFRSRLSDGIALLLLIVLVTGPVWDFIPWSLTPRGTPIGHIRLGIGIFLCHVGLIFWPVALVLFASLLRRKHWLEWIKLAALCTFCTWEAWGATHGVIWTWLHVSHWLAQISAGH